MKEGWGAANSDTLIFLTDGSDTIHVYNKFNFEFIRDIRVKSSKGTPINNLNDLVYFKTNDTNDEYLWCNIFMQDSIVQV